MKVLCSSSMLFAACVFLLLISHGDAGFRIRRRRRRSPPPNQPPRFTFCPASRTLRTTSLETVISWPPPQATDENSSPTVTQTSGPPSGSVQRAGSYRIVYSARDSRGATASCSFTMGVDVIRCPNIPSSRNRWHTCTYGVQGGSQCTFTCHHGYRLIGGSTVHCNSNTRRWSSSFPTCEEKTCNPPLRSPPYGGISCTDGNRFMSMCFYHCNEGYAIPTGQTSARYCDGDSWSGQQPTCHDIKPPEFTSCPTSFDVNVNVQSSNSNTAVITYNTPQAVDNSGHVSLRRVLGKASGSQFGSGANTVKYRAEDSAGNIMECNFTINVIIIVVAG